MAGFIDSIKRRMGRPKNEPKRDTIVYPSYVTVGRVNQIDRLVYKYTPKNLRLFSRTPYARRAINAIKNPIKMLDWEVAPKDGINWNSELRRQATVAAYCFEHPNQSDDFELFIEQFVEDFLIGAAAAETQVAGDKDRPLFMWPVDGLSIQIVPQWHGRANEPRYAQTLGYGSVFGGGDTIPLTNDELLYLRPNPSTETPFGFGPLEIAFKSIARALGVAEFAGNVAGNARPSIGLNMPGLSSEEAQAMRAYWRNEVEGQGLVPFLSLQNGPDGKPSDVSVLRLYPEGDSALYLKYQEFLVREIAAAFDLSPQNFGIERDVNRNTSEVAEDRDWAQVIRPTARTVARALTRHCLHNLLNFSQLEFRFRGLDREDEMATAQILERRYKTNSITPNEIRAKFDEPPLKSQWADLVYADMQIAIEAARSAKEIIDNDLPEPHVLPPPAVADQSQMPVTPKRIMKPVSKPKKG